MRTIRVHHQQRPRPFTEEDAQPPKRSHRTMTVTCRYYRHFTVGDITVKPLMMSHPIIIIGIDPLDREFTLNCLVRKQTNPKRHDFAVFQGTILTIAW